MESIAPAPGLPSSPLLGAVLAVVGPEASAAQVQQRLEEAGADVPAAATSDLLAALARMGLVRVSRTGTDGATFVLTTLGRGVVERGLTTDVAASLEQLETLRTDLVSTIAHELRTPLTAVRSNIGLLLDPKTRPTDAQRDALLQSIERNADRMQRLIADVLDLSRFRSGTVVLQLRRFRAVALAESAIAVVAPLAGQRELEITTAAGVDNEREVYGDRRRLEQALLNLLSNAVKFSPTGSSIEVFVDVRGDMTTWSVTDRGAGISAEDQTRLFERFFVGRGDSSGEGVGLGLPSALAIAQAHGGTIEVDSDLGRGSSFTLAVPTAGPEDEEG